VELLRHTQLRLLLLNIGVADFNLALRMNLLLWRLRAKQDTVWREWIHVRLQGRCRRLPLVISRGQRLNILRVILRLLQL